MKSKRLNKLPLLGSNQDSPDPESDASVRPRGVAELSGVVFPPVSATAPTNPPTIPHTLAGALCALGSLVLHVLTTAGESLRGWTE